MKKIFTLLFVITSFVFSVSATDWCGNSFIIINGVWHGASNSYAHDGGYFDGKDLGTFDLSSVSSFTIGGELQVYPKSDIDATLWFQIDDQAPVDIALPKTGEEGNNSKHYSDGHIVDISSLTAGNYSLKVWFQHEDKYDSNGGANFIATFSISNTVSINNATLAELNAYADGNSIVVKTENYTKADIYNLQGKSIDSKAGSNITFSGLTSGLYLVKANGLIKKVIIR